MKTFAEAVADADAKKLAAAVKVTPQAVYDWKNRKSIPGVALLPALATALGWPLAKLTVLVAEDTVALAAERKKVAR